ncbi:MAG: FtsX-like permease family protein [Hungatella sp.]|nr:FtsX-like permease family protein [Hungatella sp.]
MRMYWRNILRDARKNWGAYVGASCIIAFGVLIYIGMMDAIYNLKDQLDLYYQQSNMAEVFADVSAFPQTEFAALETIPGIDTAYGRLTQDVRVLIDDQKEIVSVHLMAYAETDQLNFIHIAPEKKITQEDIYLGNKMFKAYNYSVGEPLQLLIKGQLVNFKLAGFCRSAEYIYVTPPSGGRVPDSELYDIACVDKNYLEELTGMPGYVNELGFILEPGYTFEDVRYELKEHLGQYGVKSLYDRSDQTSYDFVEGEVNTQVVLGSFFMILFMSISVFMLYVVLKKIIDQHRRMIGTMKASGFHTGELMLGYIMLGVGIGFSGAVLAGVLAIPFGNIMFSRYSVYFNLPDAQFRFYWKTRIIGAFVSILTSIFAVYAGIRSIAKITPAEAMRPSEPAAARILKFPEWINRRLYVMHKIGLRSMVRSPFRTFVIVLAIAFPFGVSSALLSFEGVLDQAFMNQFTEVQTYDMQIFLDNYVPYARAEAAGAQLEGVVKSEAITSIGVQLKKDNLIQYVMLMGLDSDSELYKIMDWKKVFYQPADDGMILSKTLADKLRVKEGDFIEIYNALLAPVAIQIPINRVIHDNFGGGCYLSAKGFSKYFNTDMISNIILLKAQSGELDHVKEQVLKTSRVTNMVDNDRIRRSYREQLKATMEMMTMFAVATAVCGMILINNILMINVRERRVEYGTLMVLGITAREFRSMIFFEQCIYFFSGIVLGFPILEGVKRVIEHTMAADSIRVKMTVFPVAYVESFLICLIILVGSSIAVMRKVNKILPVDILKDKE